MFDHMSLSPEHEADAKVLDKLTRDRYSKLEQSDEWRRRTKLQDGNYQITRLLDAMGDLSVTRNAPYEYAESQRIAERAGRQPTTNYFFVPCEGRRDLSVASNAQLVQTDVGAGNTFVDFLDSFFLFQKLGITRISVTRPATIPGASGNVTTTTLANETSTVAETNITFKTAASSPKTIGAYIEVSDLFLKQGSVFAQAFVWRALARAVSAEVSRQILVGTGANGQLSGLFTASGVGSLPGGSANFAKVLDAIGAPETANGILVPQSAGFVMAPSVAKLLRAREKATGSGMVMTRDDVAGYQGVVTMGASPNTLAFGDWSQLCLLEYGLLEVSRDPYGANSALFQKSLVGIRVLWTVDTILSSPASFVTTGALN